MARNRYVRDYRILETVDERGRIKADYEYIGKEYYFLCGGAAAARETRKAFALCAAGWICFLGAMLPVSAAMHTLYVALPFIFTALPLGMLTALVMSALRLSETLEHRFADRLENSYPVRALFTAALPAAALAGEAVRLLTDRSLAVTGDAVFCVFALLLSVCGGALFSRRKAS